jgi:hypothetical protein
MFICSGPLACKEEYRIILKNPPILYRNYLRVLRY